MRFSCLLLFSFPFLSGLFAQKLSDARTLHHPDSGMLTAGALDAAGNLYLASTLNLKMLPGESGILGLFPAGDPVISKYGPDGALLWRREFPGNYVRICDLAVLPDGDPVITGGYTDTLRLAPGWSIPGNPVDASFFIARLDAQGDVGWIDTDVSTLPEDGFGWSLAVGPGAIYVAGAYQAIESYLRRYDFDGTLRAAKILDIRSISDLALDAEGRLYAAGTAAPGAMFANLPVPWPPQSTGYANYLARLDSSLSAEWVVASNYITFDWHPKAAVYGDHVFFLSNDFDPGPNQPGCIRLKAFTADGNLTRSDSILPHGSIPADYQHFALAPFCDRLLLEYPTGGGMAIRAYDGAFQDSLLVQTSAGDFEASFPFICTNAEKAVFGSNFRNAGLTVSDDLILENAQAPGYQQFILELECPETPSAAGMPASAAGWLLAPNPAGETAYLYRRPGGAMAVARVEVLDARGQVHWRGNVGPEGMLVPTAVLPAGAYFLRVTESGKTAVIKAMKQ